MICGVGWGGYTSDLGNYPYARVTSSCRVAKLARLDGFKRESRRMSGGRKLGGEVQENKRQRREDSGTW